MKNLEINQMEILSGGTTNPFTDKEACEDLAFGLGGAATVFAVGAWWTGAGGLFALGLGITAFAYGAYCRTL